jgi:hypothetical protein
MANEADRFMSFDDANFAEDGRILGSWNGHSDCAGILQALSFEDNPTNPAADREPAAAPRQGACH